MTDLKLVTPQDNITTSDIDSLDIKKLRLALLKNTYIVEAALFEQAGIEQSRATKTRSLLTKIEDDLFSDINFNYLSTDQKIDLYKSITNSNKNALQFLQQTQANVLSSIDVVTKLETLKQENEEKEITQESNSIALEEVKKRILEQIKERVK